MTASRCATSSATSRSTTRRTARAAATATTIPDPQALETFERSRLDWAERSVEPHASTLRLYEALLRLRRSEPALRWTEGATLRAAALDENTLLLRREADDHAVVAVVRLRGGPATVEPDAELLGDRRWTVLATTEDAAFAVDPAAIEVETESSAPRIRFERPGAVLLRGAALA